MSKNQVKVTVNLVDGFDKTLKKLDKQLEKIDKKKVAPKFDFDDNGQIEQVKAQLSSIDDVVNTKLNVLGKPALKETQASVKSLSGVENVYVKTHDHELNSTIAKMEALKRRQAVRGRGSAQSEFTENIRRSTTAARRLEGRGGQAAPHGPYPLGPNHAARRRRDKVAESIKRASLPVLKRSGPLASTNERTGLPVRRGSGGGLTNIPFLNNQGQMRRPPIDIGPARVGKSGLPVTITNTRDVGQDGRAGRTVQRGRRLFSRLFDGRLTDKLRNSHRTARSAPTADEFANSMLRIIPRGQLTQDLAAFFMPFMFVAYTAAMGAFAAALAPAIAGVGALTLGILGFGENAADSLKLAEVRLRIFGRELHKVMKPASKTFAPFVDSWFQTLPHTIGRELNQPLMDMVVWMPTVEQVGSGLLGWTRDFLNLMNQLEPIISNVVMQLGADTGDALLRFFEWLIIELNENYDLILDTLGALKELAIFVYRLSLLWSQVIVNLSPLISALSRLANFILNVPVLGALLSWAAAVGLLAAIMIKVIGLFGAFAGMVAATFSGTVIAGLAKLAAGYIGLTAAISKAATAKALLLGLMGPKGWAILAAGVAVGTAAGVSALGSSGGSAPGAGTGRPSRSTPSGGNTINIYGNPDNATVQQFKDMFPGEYRTETNVNNRMTPQ